MHQHPIVLGDAIERRCAGLGVQCRDREGEELFLQRVEPVLVGAAEAGLALDEGFLLVDDALASSLGSVDVHRMDSSGMPWGMPQLG